MEKAFFSEITRCQYTQNKGLYDLLRVKPAKAISVTNHNQKDFDFKPKNVRLFTPKEKSKFKVKTVRDIRHEFEKDILNDLPTELERLENILLRKIRKGSSNKDKTRDICKSILNSDKPISRTLWQMLIKINPEKKLHSSQYVFWNKKLIRLNGSRGGDSKLVFDFDVRKDPIKCTTLSKDIRKKGLLRNSLSVNFRPGPLKRKHKLDNSYQKEYIGDIKIADLPKPRLEVWPSCGIALDNIIANFLNNYRDENGVISQKWAEFAVSVFGPTKNNLNHITFDLSYKNDQHRIVMRQAKKDSPKMINYGRVSPIVEKVHDNDIISEIRFIVDEMLGCIEISLNEDMMYSGEEEPRIVEKTIPTYNSLCFKEKKKRKFCELNRLDVTVISLSEDLNTSKKNKCNNTFCSLGCICDSLQCTFQLKKHCGRVECMFSCKCNFSKYEAFCNEGNDNLEFLPGLLKLNNDINSALSKEEQKFQRTVIVTDTKSILLRSKKRNIKSPNNMDLLIQKHLGTNAKSKLSVVLLKLNLENIEKWCMVHNLYRCFCKGKIIESFKHFEPLQESNSAVILIDDDLSIGQVKESNTFNNFSTEDKSNECRLRNGRLFEKKFDTEFVLNMNTTECCARVMPYSGRKHNVEHYLKIARKIHDLEMNDKKLRTRLFYLVGENIKELDKSVVEKSKTIKNSSIENSDIENYDTYTGLIQEKSLFKNIDKIDFSQAASDSSESYSEPDSITLSVNNQIRKNSHLVAWLESSYKRYKKRLHLGLVKNVLEAPQKGKVVLYPWDFILSRYSERKNLFLVSKQVPFRIYMVVNTKHPQFENCINIDDIRFADINKYPVTVKNLLTNTSGTKESFCILFGMNHSWELIGSVIKVKDSIQENFSNNEKACNDLSQLSFESTSSILMSEDIVDQNESLLMEDTTEIMKPFGSSEQPVISQDNKTPFEISKWFVMTVENDFTELQFYRKGFYVKHNSLFRAIKVARASGKTVRLSSQQCNDKLKQPLFGIYAIPNANEQCVIVGPYEEEETLGIETVKTGNPLEGKNHRTRGVWIRTNKINNSDVIDNPLSFLPLETLDYSLMLPLDDDCLKMTNKTNFPLQRIDSPNPDIVKKAVIKIPKANTFIKLIPKVKNKYIAAACNAKDSSIENSICESSNSAQIVNRYFTSSAPNSSENLSHTLSVSSQSKYTTDKKGILSNDLTSKEVSSIKLNESECQTNKNTNTLLEKKTKPIAEVAPQMKISRVYSKLRMENHVNTNKPQKRMLILKPEEINGRLANKKLILESVTKPSIKKNAKDLEEFLDSSKNCLGSNTEIVVISDDEEDFCSPIYIKCSNVKDLGLLPGKINNKGLISFQFPTFKYSDFYKHDVAFEKIVQVLSRRVFIPPNLRLEWKIVQYLDSAHRLLRSSDLKPDLVLTKKGLVHKALLKNKKVLAEKTNDRKEKMNISVDDTSEVIKEEKSDEDYEAEPIIINLYKPPGNSK